MDLLGLNIFKDVLKVRILQIKIKEEDILKTVFKTHHGHFKFKVMPFENKCASNLSVLDE